jgi:hypothetical protein
VKEKPFLRFLLLCIIAGIMCLAAAFLIQNLFFPSKSFVSVYSLIPFVMLVTVVVHFVLIKASTNPRTFIGKFVAFSGLKMIVFLIAILIYALSVKNEIVIFMLAFLITYFIFTILEISAILKFLKKISS